jgi:hypothetical protein
MADGKVIRGERRWFDIFSDGWSNNILRNATVYSPEGTKLSEPKKIKMVNRWVVTVEDDTN